MDADSLQRILAQAGVNESDREAFAAQGKSLQSVAQEWEALQGELRYPAVHDSARYDNGFLVPLSRRELEACVEAYRQLEGWDLCLFLPAAGAASRQFQMLKTVQKHPAFQQLSAPAQIAQEAQKRCQELAALEPLSGAQEAELKLLKEVAQHFLRFWEEGIEGRKLALVHALEERFPQAFDEALKARDSKAICALILDPDEGLGYEFLPKALLAFHGYPGESPIYRTALEEHIRTWIPLFRGCKRMHLHLAISEQHAQAIGRELEQIRSRAAVREALAEAGVDDLHVDWSFQAAATDAVALDLSSQQLARTPEGSLLTRKAGHGALLPNIAALDVDGLWIQTIDNILYHTPARQRVLVRSKQIMAGLAVRLQEQIGGFIEALKASGDPAKGGPAKGGPAKGGPAKGDLEIVDQVVAFLRQRMGIQLLDPPDATSLVELLDRPLAVAGYVPLAPGQKGGGPFALEQRLGSLRVLKTNTVEGAEFEGGQSHPIFQSGICFNPVNLFISAHRHDGSRFDLQQYADPSRYFASHKSDASGRPIKAYERPGLWNGALARLLQVSVGLLACTFSAVKDSAGPESFLSPLHQPNQAPIVCDLDRQRQIVDEAAAAWFEQPLEP